MKTIKIIETEADILELIESDANIQPRASKFTIWLNASIIDDAKTLKGANNKFDKIAKRNNLI